MQLYTRISLKIEKNVTKWERSELKKHTVYTPDHFVPHSYELFIRAQRGPICYTMPILEWCIIAL